jgi:prevent-host-death family protein
MITVSIHEAKTNLSSLIKIIEQGGDRVIITRHGVAVAEISPLPRGKRTVLHSKIKDITILYNPTETTEEEWDDL